MDGSPSSHILLFRHGNSTFAIDAKLDEVKLFVALNN